MKKIFLIVATMLVSIVATAQVQQMLGDWKTVEAGQEKSIVHIYKATDGLYYGKIVKLFGVSNDEVCVACEGADKNKPVVGLVIIRGMKEVDGELKEGKVLDPENGKFYYCKISLKDGKLVLKGSLDKKGLLGRSQTWVRP